jgi:hypothetical protein
MKPAGVREMTVNPREGTIATINLKLSFDTATMPIEQQSEIWNGIGATLRAAMTEEERPAFLTQQRQHIDRLTSTPPAKRRAARSGKDR